jgi:hypothetical protein
LIAPVSQAIPGGPRQARPFRSVAA